MIIYLKAYFCCLVVFFIIIIITIIIIIIIIILIIILLLISGTAMAAGYIISNAFICSKFSELIPRANVTSLLRTGDYCLVERFVTIINCFYPLYIFRSIGLFI